MRAFAIGLAALLALPACGDDDDAVPLAERLCAWTEHPSSPLLEAPNGETLLGDPTVVPPGDAPDGRWHLFANSLLGVHHYTSADGIAWDKLGEALFRPGAFRAFVFADAAGWAMVFEQFLSLETSEIRLSRSTDLVAWSAPTTLLEPELPWEQTLQATIGNPYVIRQGGEYWLYYSADGVFQPDVGFTEPRVIGLARAASLDGPWVREPQPILAPDPDDPWQNRGAGSMKLLDERVGGKLVAFQNGIYSRDGVSGSAIHVRASDDGVTWEPVCDGPVLAPTGRGWRADYVYAFDSVRVGDTVRLYFNAREGHEVGVERIGLATLPLPDRGPPAAGSP